MATDERKVQLGVSVDATEARQGFNEVKASAKDMAQAVAAEGDKAGKAIGGVGDGGQAASRKIERETANIIQSVQRATAAMEAGKKSGSEYYEALAKQRGVDVNVLKPYLDQLAAVEAKQKQAAAAMSGGTASMDKLGVSAAQTAAAMRGVPAQFTDIITSLQGGQKPLTVLLQQGGQLKDMFGGIGPAARALGGYVAGLINPFTLAAAAAGGLFLAYRAGAAEGEEFRKTLILTGNALGLTADKMTAMSARIGAVVGTQHQAAEAINVMAQSARVGAAELESMTATAVRWQQATGTAVSETAKAFAELAKSPVEASLKLNESVNYLTDSVYRQIKALQGAGKEAEAAALAQKAYADALNDRAPKMVQNLGAIETAWKNIKSAIAGAWSAALEIGRDKSMVDQIKSQTAAVEALEQKLNDRQARGIASGKLQAQLDAAKGLLKNLQDQATATDAVAKADKDRADQLERGKRITDYTGDNGRKTRAQQMRDELAKEKGLYEERKKDAAGNAKDLLAIENAYQTAASTIRDKYKDKKSAGGGGISATDTEVASLRGRIEAEKQLAAQLAATAGTASKLNEGEKLSLQYAEKLKLATNAKTKARLEDLKAMADTLGVQQRANADELEYAKQREKYFDDQNKVVASIEAKAVALEDEIATYGMGKAAIEATAIARLEEQKAVLAGFTGSEENIRLIDQEIDARKRLMSATSQKESLDANKKAAEQAAADWKRGSEEINRSLTDALLRGFESGKGFAENLRDTLKNMFKTLVLRPIISAVMQPVAGGIQSMLGMGGQSGVGGVGGAINLLSGARNVYAALQGGVSLPGFMATPLAEMAGGDTLGNLIALKGAGTGGATPGIAGVSGAMNAAAGIGGGYMLGSTISGQYNAIGGSQAWASGGGAAMGAAIGSIVPGIGTIIGGLIGGALGGVVNRAFGMGPKEYGHRGFEGTVTSGGFDGQNFADWKQKGGWFRSNRSGTEYSAIDQPVLDKLNSGFDAMVGTLKGLRSAAGEPAFNESLNDFRYGMRNDWSVPENFNKSMTDLSDALSRHLFPGLDGLKREGESLLDTAVRLTGVFKATSNTAEILGKDISTAFGGAAWKAPVRASTWWTLLAARSSSLPSLRPTWTLPIRTVKRSPMDRSNSPSNSMRLVSLYRRPLQSCADGLNSKISPLRERRSTQWH
ncbi:phage tail length tape measure family protein [Cupriavidus basilensis]